MNYPLFTTDQAAVIALQPVDDFSLFLTPTPPFGVPRELRPAVDEFYKRVTAVADSLLNVTRSCFLQFNQLALNNCHELLSRNAPVWVPELAMGVFPELPAPRMFTKEEFEELDPNVPLRPLNHQLFKLTADGNSPESKALPTMTGTGTVYLVWGDPEQLAGLSATLRDSMVEEIFRIYPAYAPLFSQASFEDRSSSKLRTYLQPVHGFLRESVEDQGILWGMRAPAAQVLDLLHARDLAGASNPGVQSTLPEQCWTVNLK